MTKIKIKSHKQNVRFFQRTFLGTLHGTSPDRMHWRVVSLLDCDARFYTLSVSIPSIQTGKLAFNIAGNITEQFRQVSYED
jgi:hypothetical protein